MPLMAQETSKPYAEPKSLWHAVSPPGKRMSPLQGSIDIDVAIIGGGYTGFSTALHLLNSGASVCIVEANTIGSGGSGRNNGQVIPVLSRIEPEDLERHYGEAGERLVGLVRDSAKDLFQLVRRENITCEAEQTGWFQPAHTAAHSILCEKRNAAWAARGAPCHMLDETETSKLLGSDAWDCGMLNPSGGHINPLMLLRGLAQTCDERGARIFENTPAHTIIRSGQRWRVTTPQGSVLCNAVLLATNAYSGEISSTLAPKVARSIIPVTSWQVSTRPIDEALTDQILPQRQAVSDTRADLQFFRYDARNNLVSGGALALPFNGVNRIKNLIGRRLEKAFPLLGKPAFSHVWSGLVAITPDRYPHFHQLGPNYWSAVGFNGRGVALSLAIGRELAKAINGADTKDLALPLSTPKTVRFHGLVRKMARAALPYYRWRDKHPKK